MPQAASHRVRRLPGIVAQAMRPLPLMPLELALRRLLSGILERHPDLLDRLRGLEQRLIAIDPGDLPFVIILEPRVGTICLQVVRGIADEHVHARIRGPLPLLMGLVDGAYDGDALFFSRDLTIEGDIELVLALRNAIDDADIDIIGEVEMTFGSFGFPFDRIGKGISIVLRKALHYGERLNRGALQ